MPSKFLSVVGVWHGVVLVVAERELSFFYYFLLFVWRMVAEFSNGGYYGEVSLRPAQLKITSLRYDFRGLIVLTILLINRCDGLYSTVLDQCKLKDLFSLNPDDKARMLATNPEPGS
ncbi:hypothetical protein HOY80DRAFT_492051 [Tuber brumale]|nr:hypothetical protein HOY80DRAFT_492051 [Tuber brumale]